MSEVVFITPNFGGLVREEPVGTLLLATILQSAGIHCDILPFRRFGDVKNFNQFIDSSVEMVFAHAPRIVSFYTRCDSYHISLKIAERIKMHSPDVYIVFGGPQADLSAEDTLREIPYVDFICCGEGETTIIPFFSSLIAGSPDLTVRGLAYRSNGSIMINPRPELIADLDSLPPINYSLLDFKTEGNSHALKNLFPVDVGRGCPFACTYCSTKTFWGRKYRLKSAEKIVEEIKYIHQVFGMTRFNFVHDMFTLNREKVLQVCRMLRELDFPIRWRCSARTDCLDEELIDIMADSGLDSIFIGVETGSPRMQRLIQKNLNLDNVLSKLEYMTQKGIAVTASFIFGFPDETLEDFSQTMELMAEICKLPKIVVQHHLCAFFAGTELTKQYGQSIAKSSVLSDTTGEIAVHECEDIISAHPILFPHFYEYKTELRERVKYYPQFFRCWRVMQPVYDYIFQKYYKGHIYDMLFEFSERNSSLLEANENWFEILKQDTLINSFSNDEHFFALKAASQFLIWKAQPPIGSTEIFEYDISGLTKGAKISELKKCITIASFTKGEDGTSSMAFYKKS